MSVQKVLSLILGLLCFCWLDTDGIPPAAGMEVLYEDGLLPAGETLL